jgi:hypothetical protein
MIGLLSLAVGLVGQWLLGLFVAARLFSIPYRIDGSKTDGVSDRDAAPGLGTPLAELAGLGCALGVGVTGVCLFVWSFCGGLLGTLPSGLLTLTGLVMGGPLVVRRLREWRAESRSRTGLSDVVRQDRAIAHACQILIGGLLVAAALQTLLTPQKLWDERAIFAIKAEVLFEEKSINSPILLDPDFVQYHPRYPLLLPLAEQHLDALLGRVDDRLSKLVFTLLYCGLVLTTAGVLLRHMSPGRAWTGALVMATVPVMMPYEYGFLCGQADAPVACYHGLSVLYLWDAAQGLRRGAFRTGSIVIAGILGGLAAFTKDEGIAFLIIDTAILCLFVVSSLRNRVHVRRLLIEIVVFAGAVATVLAGWFVHRRQLPLTTEMNYFGRMTVPLFVGRLETLGWSVPHLLNRMFREWREWGLQWWLMVAAFASAPMRVLRQSQLLLLLDVVGALGSLLVAGMLAPAQLDEHLGGSSHRFLMQIAPVAILFAVTMFPDRVEGRSSGNDS